MIRKAKPVELTEEQFAEIVGEAISPVYDTAADDADDRRQHPRVGFGSRARIFPLIESAGGNGCAVLIRDISRGGIGFIFSYKLEVGDEFIVHIPRKDRPVIQIQCMTQRCDMGGTGGFSYVIGASFELVLDSTLAPTPRPEAEGQTAGISQWPGAPEEVARESLVTSLYKRVSTISVFDRSSSRIRNRLRSNAAVADDTSDDKSEKSATVPATSETEPAAEVEEVAPFPIIETSPIDPNRPRSSLFAPRDEAAAVIDASVETATPVQSAAVVEAAAPNTTVVAVIAPVIEPIAVAAPVQVVAPVTEPIAPAVVAQTVIEPVTPAVVAAVEPIVPIIVPTVKPVVLAPVVAAKMPAPVVVAKKAHAVVSQNEATVVLPWEMDAPANKVESAKGSNESSKPVAEDSTGDSRELLSVFIAPLTCRRVRRRR